MLVKIIGSKKTVYVVLSDYPTPDKSITNALYDLDLGIGEFVSSEIITHIDGCEYMEGYGY
jgi:hypothetical protein